MDAVRNKILPFRTSFMGALKASIFLLCLFCLTACGASLSSRFDKADSLAQKRLLERHVIAAGPFDVTTYMSSAPRHNIGRVYIEGDGLAWISRTQPSLNPTPIDPYALRLASVDQNNVDVVYFARPCQYSGWRKAGLCPMRYWTTHRYAPDVVQAYTHLLEQLKRQRGWSGVELVGYSGGGTLALLLARGREDILSVRTVAGNLDIDAHSRWHNVDLMPYSLNPANYTHQLSHIPQRHFNGGDDIIVPLPIAQSYATKMPDASCLKVEQLENLSHGKGWVERWPGLLSRAVSC